MNLRNGFLLIVAVLIVAVVIAVGVASYTVLVKKEQRPAAEISESMPVPAPPVHFPPPSSGISETESPPQAIILPLPSPQSSPTLVRNSRPTPLLPRIEAQMPSPLDRELQELEREILVLTGDGRPIGPEHYAQLNSRLDAALTDRVNQERVQKLRAILETVNPHNIASAPSPQPPTTSPTPAPNCISNQSPVFTNHITDTSKVSYVAPPPTIGSGPSLKTHSYVGTNHINVPVYAPAAMILKSGSHYVGGPYTFEFQVSCEVTVRFGHITNPIDAIRKLLPSEPQSGSQTQELSPVSFAAGELVAYTTGTDAAGNWDFGVYNSAVSNRYASDPNWSQSTTYTTAVCPFDYFTPDLKSAYTAKFDSEILGGNPPHGESFCKA